MILKEIVILDMPNNIHEESILKCIKEFEPDIFAVFQSEPEQIVKNYSITYKL